MEHKSTKVEVRMSESEKSSLQAAAQAAGVGVSEYVRTLVSSARTAAPSTSHGAQMPAELLAMLDGIEAAPKVDVNAPELESLRGWLDLRESDGEVDDELKLQLAGWKAYAEAHGVSLAEVLEAVVVEANAALVA